MTEIKYSSLVPNDERDEKKDVYIDALDWALKEKDIKNIAITGAYGAGKSSIIKTYIKERQLDEFVLPIAIATFQDEKNITGDSSLLENLLEQQILQQMFYKVKPDKIHKSKFISLRELSIWNILIKISMVLISVLLTFFMFKEDWINKIFQIIVAYEYGIFGTLLIVIASLIGIAVYGYLIYQVFLFINKIGLSKFGVGGTSIEFNFKDGSTVFNKYIDEIIYLFNKTKYKYIIFEDLDRFESIEIFERLRGLNALLNNSPLLKGKKIVFIYALKDDVFTHQDEDKTVYNRAKFFDFIIPTVKVVHTSNAEDILMEKLKDLIDNNSINNSLSKIFISDIALFINDMRTLLNICNEFRTFSKALKGSGVVLNNLLAFVVYKNIYPGDYTELLGNKGLIYNIFNSKEALIINLQEELKTIDTLISDKDSYFEQKSDVGFLFIKRLNLLKKYINIEGNYWDCSAYNKGLNILNELKEYDLNKIITIHNEQYHQIESLTINELLTNKGKSKNFIDILNQIEMLNERDITFYEQQQEEIIEKINFIKVNPLANILKQNRDNFNIDFSKHQLLFYLIQNSWLNETYEEYITYFYPGSLSPNDVKFVKSIRLGIPEFPNLELKNTEGIFNRLSIDDISNKAVLNFTFFKYLIETGNKYEKNKWALKNMVQILYGDFKNQYTFFREFIKINRENMSVVKELFNQLLQIADDIYDIILEKESNVDMFLDLFLNVLDIKHFQVLNTSKKLEASLAYYPSMLGNQIANNRLEHILSKLEVKFEDLPVYSHEKKSIVIDTESYLINLHNLKILLDQEVLNYEIVQRDVKVLEYVDRNFDDFVGNVLLQQEEYREKEDLLIKLINRSDLLDNLKEELILKMVDDIFDITGIDNIEALTLVKKHGRAVGNWKNIIYFNDAYESNPIIYDLGDVFLVNEHIWPEFIEDTKENISQVDDKNYQKVINMLIESEKIEDINLEEILVLLENKIVVVEPSKVTTNIYIKLIKHKLLAWNIEVYELLLKNMIESENKIVVDYYLNEINNSKDELSYLVNHDGLLWGERLLQLLVETDIELALKYVLSIFKYISDEEKIVVIQSEFIPLVEEIISYLEENEDESLLYKYLIMWIENSDWDEGKLYEFVNSHTFKWNVELYYKIKEVDETASMHYLTTFEDDLVAKLIEVSVDQETFNEIFNTEVTLESKLEVLNSYKDLNIGIETEAINWLLDIEDREKIYALLDQKIVEKNFLLRLTESRDFARVFKECLEYYKYNKKDIYKLLEKSKQPYRRLIDPRKQVKFENIQEISDFLNVLTDIGFINKPKSIENGFIVYNKANLEYS